MHTHTHSYGSIYIYLSEGLLIYLSQLKIVSLPQASIKRIMQSITGSSSTGQNVIIAMSGIAKVRVNHKDLQDIQ